MESFLGRSPLARLPVAFTRNKLLFRPRIRTPSTAAPLEFTAQDFSQLIKSQWCKKTTQYCELLRSESLGKPFFDYDRKLAPGEPGWTPSQLESLKVALLQTVTAAITRFDEEFDQDKQIHIAQRHGYLVVDSVKTYKASDDFPNILVTSSLQALAKPRETMLTSNESQVSFRFWVSGYSVSLATLNHLRDVLGFNDPYWDWGIYNNKTRLMSVLGACKGLNQDYRFLLPCLGQNVETGYSSFLVQALEGSELSLAELVEATASADAVHSPAFSLFSALTPPAASHFVTPASRAPSYLPPSTPASALRESSPAPKPDWLPLSSNELLNKALAGLVAHKVVNGYRAGNQRRLTRFSALPFA